MQFLGYLRRSRASYISYWQFQFTMVKLQYIHSLNIMNKETQKNPQRWRILTHSPQIQCGQSGNSRQTAQHSRYTPTKKTERTPQNKLKLVVLQTKKALQEPSKMYKNKIQTKCSINQQSKSLMLLEPFSGKTFLTYHNDSQFSDQNYKKEQGQRNGRAVRIKNDEIIEQYFQKPVDKNQRKLARPILLNRIETFTTQKKNSQESKNEQSHTFKTPIFANISMNTNLTVQQIFEKCMEFLRTLEEEMIKYRIQVHRILQQKQQYYSEMKEKILIQFSKKQMKIKKNQNRALFQKYLAKKQEKNLLSRITSETRFQRLTSPVSGYNFGNQQRQKSLQQKSVANSRSNSSFKQNFHNIFNAINVIKGELSDDGRLGAFGSGGAIRDPYLGVKGERNDDIGMDKVNSRVNIVEGETVEDTGTNTGSYFRFRDIDYNNNKQNNNRVSRAPQTDRKQPPKGNFFNQQAQLLKNWKITL